MTEVKPAPGGAFPQLTLPLISGSNMSIGAPSTDGRWQLLVVYRGRHCPLCERYLKDLQNLKLDFAERKTDIVVMSGDGLEKAKDMAEICALDIPVAYEMSVPDMRRVGLYVSEPRSSQETDQPFPEPGLFLLRPDGTIQIVDISNAPFSRPDPAAILRGLGFIQDRDYPIRGTF